MRRKAADFAREVADDPYEIELESGTVLTLRTSRDAPMDLTDAIMAWNPGDPGPKPREMQLRHMVGDEHFDEFWAEWKNYPAYALEDMINECDKHYVDGVDEGKATSSGGSSTGTATRSRRTSGSASK